MIDFSALCVRPGQFLLPGAEFDMQKWAVVACDQYTAQESYWQAADALVGGAPSALRLILPECYLNQADERVPEVQRTMQRYLNENVLSRTVNGMVLLRRTTRSGARLGLLLTVDLEAYDFSPCSTSKIRPTEGTIPSRVPPRLKVREHAPLELSHILLLANDQKRTVLEPLIKKADVLPKLYDIALMQNGGRLEGWAVEDDETLADIEAALSALQKSAPEGGIVFAVGDGNHSLATARTHWLHVKETLSPDEQAAHPARFATVELTNLHDPALLFEPIHRVVFGHTASAVKAMLEGCEPALELQNPDLIIVHEKGDFPLKIGKPLHTLPVGTVQALLDRVPGLELDYVHGECAVRELVKEKNAVGILLPPIDKASLFTAVSKNGPLPRKTFSMGEADEKRFYVEARRIEKE